RHAQEFAQTRSAAAAHWSCEERSRSRLWVCEDSASAKGRSRHTLDLLVPCRKSQAQSCPTPRRPLSPPHQSNRRGPCGAVDSLCATHADRKRLPITEKRAGYPPHLPSTRTPGRRSRADRVPGLLPSGDSQESADDSRARSYVCCCVREARHHPDGRG